MHAFELGVDADYDYFTDAQSNLATVLERIEYSIAVTRAIYMRDALIRPYLGRVIIRSTLEHDPYSTLTQRDFLDAIRTEWNNNHNDANQDTVAGVAGSGAGSGIAWQGQIGTSYGYSVNGSNSEGEFEGVFRHELGHNWSCGHFVGGSPEGTGLMGGNSAGRITGCENYRILRHRNEKALDGIVDNEGKYADIELPPYASLDAVELIRNLEGTTLFDETQQVKVLVPPNDIGTTWQGGNEPFNDSSWRSGTNGVGYERNNGYEPYINIDVDAEMANHTSCYIRIPFDVTGVNLTTWNYLALQMRYDDGFVAYLNGTRIISVNDPETLNHLSSATRTNDDSLASTFENFDISSYLENLKPGQNILAIHALNESTSSSDFLNQAKLITGSASDLPTDPVLINILANDHDANGQRISLSSFDTTTAEGGSVLRQGEELIYTPPPTLTGLDWFNYNIADTMGRTAVGVVVVKPKIILRTLALNPFTRSIPTTGGNGTFTVSSNTNWSWSDNVPWLTSNEPISQNDDQTFSYSVAPNTSTAARTATITITAGNLTRTHTVTQSAAEITLTVRPTTRRIPTTGGNGDFAVSSNTSWSWSDNAAWLTSNESASQNGNQAFSYSVAENTSAEARTATITITSGNITRTHTVTQAGAEATLTVSPDTRSIAASGGNLSFTISSNASWNWSDNATWLTAPWNPTQSGSVTFSYSVAANTSTQTRTATITITAGNLTRTHTVSQSAAEITLTVRPTTRRIPATGGNDTFTVSSNTNWNWSSNVPWLTSNEPISQNDDQTFSYSVAPNASTQSRTTTITVSAANLTRTHTVTQAGAPQADTTIETTLETFIVRPGQLYALSLGFTAESGKSYRIMSSSNLRDWAIRETGIPGNGDIIQRSYSFSPSARPRWFLRVEEE